MCGTAMFNVIVNMSLMFSFSIKDAIFKIKKKCNNKRHMRQLKQSSQRYKNIRGVSERRVAWKIEQAMGQVKSRPGMGNG